MLVFQRLNHWQYFRAYCNNYLSDGLVYLTVQSSVTIGITFLPLVCPRHAARLALGHETALSPSVWWAAYRTAAVRGMRYFCQVKRNVAP